MKPLPRDTGFTAAYNLLPRAYLGNEGASGTVLLRGSYLGALSFENDRVRRELFLRVRTDKTIKQKHLPACTELTDRAAIHARTVYHLNDGAVLKRKDHQCLWSCDRQMALLPVYITILDPVESHRRKGKGQLRHFEDGDLAIGIACHQVPARRGAEPGHFL